MSVNNPAIEPCCAKKGLFGLINCKEEGRYPCFNCEQGVCDDHATRFGDGKILCPACNEAEDEERAGDESEVSLTGRAVTGIVSLFTSSDRDSVSNQRSQSDRGSSVSSFRDS